MLPRKLIIYLTCSLMPTIINAQDPQDYTVPLTEHGQPDFQSVWSTGFLTLLERPDFASSLVVNPEQAATMAARILAIIPDVRDPDDYLGISDLLKVKGEFRTSIIVEPANGKLPYSQRGQEIAMKALTQDFDHPEQLDLAVRCLAGMGEAPVRTFPAPYYYQFIQTRDHIVLHVEDPVPYRIINLDSDMPEQALPSHSGYSVGHWDGDSLVVETSHFRADHPALKGFLPFIVINEDTLITERFTRVSDNELHYYYTVEDEDLYTQTWSGEFSFTRDSGLIYEYACHEGNYSLPGIMLGGQRQAAEN